MEGVAGTELLLLERSEELARVEAALAEARAGRGTFVVLEGPAGIGKTALLGAVRSVAAGSGMRVLRSRGAELERDFAFGVVRQIFEPPLAEASESERGDLLQAAAGTAASLLALPGAASAEGPLSEGADPSFAILHGLYWLCANLAACAPLCVIVDDAHWADAPSLRYLSFLLTRLEELDAALVLATRPREGGTDAGLLATVMTDPSAEVIRLAPLTRSGVADFIESRLGATPDPAFTDACVRATRGTPFLLRELTGALGEDDIPPTAEAAARVERVGARTVSRSIRLRLRRLPGHAGRLAGALAVLEQGDLLPAAQLAELDETQATEAAELLTNAGILDPGRPLRFAHPIVRGGIYTALSDAERSRGHRRAARLLATQPGAHERVAEHLLASEPAADPWVVDQLVEAARFATRSGAPESAAVFLRRVLDEPPPPALQSRLLLELGMAETSAGLPEWPVHLQRAVDTSADPQTAAAASMALALALSRAQRPADAMEVLDRAASALDRDDGELALLLEIAAVGAGMNGAVTAPAVAARRQAIRERAARDPAAFPELLALAAFSSVLSNEPADVAADLATRALRAYGDALPGADGRPWLSFATWFSQTTVSLIWAERYAQVRPLLDASIAEARATGDSSRLSAGLAHRGWLAFRRGDLVSAEADSRTALAAAELPAPAMYRVLNGGVLINALLDQGDLDAAERVLAPLEEEVEVGALTAGVARLARGRLRVAQGRTGEGLADFVAVGALATSALVTCPSYLPWRSEAAHAHMLLGERESAQRLAREELELARVFGAPRTIGVAAHAAGVVIGGDQGELLLREAVDAFARGDARLERARALADLGALVRRRNRRSEARQLLREALDGAHRVGARGIAERAETDLRATGARPRRIMLTGVESLTASERRIAEHASQGLTNREIAQTLFVTARTVEGHLTSVFRKLQLASRDELASALEGSAATAP
jgi:DNA-binding CsgD family transcriptional regulator